MIKLTSIDGKDIYIKESKVLALYLSRDRVRVCLGGDDEYSVMETMEEVLQKIKENRYEEIQTFTTTLADLLSNIKVTLCAKVLNV